MPGILVYIIYNLLLPVVLLLGMPSFLIKGWKRGGLARNFKQRFGWFSAETLGRFKGNRPIWIHAVSVGEVIVALKVIEALHAKAPDQKLILSTTTTTGFKVASEQQNDLLTVIHNPVDLPLVTDRVIRLINPKQLILIEAEIWPNLVGQLKRRGVPVRLINARLSQRSQERYLRFRPLIKPIFSLISSVTVPFEFDIDRWASLGIERDRIKLLGSVKFDNAAPASEQQRIEELKNWLSDSGLPHGSRILLAGSTHDGEEKLIAQTAAQLKKSIPNLELIIVPRHAERAPEISTQLIEAGFSPIFKNKFNRVGSGTQQGRVNDRSPTQRVWIANTTGELRAWYHLAEVVVIGKSFCGKGGQNPVEPILIGKPTIVGPNMQNFSEVVADLMSEDGIIQSHDEGSLLAALESILSNPGESRAMAERGAKAMERHLGAANRTADHILAQS